MVALALFAAGCGGSSDSEEFAQVRAELAQASAELDALKEQVATITAAPATTAAPTTTAIPTTTPAPTTTVAPTTTPAPTTTLVPIWDWPYMSDRVQYDGPYKYWVTVIESGSLEAVVVGDVVLVERAGWRARRSVLVPESWVLEIIDGGGSGGGATWTNPLDPRERVRVGTGVARGVWYERDGIDEVVPPAIPKGSIVEEIKPWTYLYEEVADGVTTTGIVEATFPNSPTATQPCCFQHASISLSKPDTAVVSAFVEFLLEPPEEVSTEGQRETSRMRFGFPATVNGVTVGLMRQTIASAGSTPVNYTMNYPFVQLRFNRDRTYSSVRQIEQTVNTWIRDHVNTQISEFLENTIPRYQENILPLTSQPNYNIEVNTTVQLLSDSYLSIHESWSGEATGTTLCPCPEFGYTFDLSDGTLLELRDLFVEESDWTQPIAEEVRRASPIEYGFVLDESELTAEKIANAAFTLTPTGLYLYLPATRRIGE